jgi:hypothetical protein
MAAFLGVKMASADPATTQTSPEEKYLSTSQSLRYCLDRTIEEGEQYDYTTLEYDFHKAYQSLDPELKNRYEKEFHNLLELIRDYKNFSGEKNSEK